ncbi:MAG: class I SAM-dependent methyltransferase [Inhella sp.]
MKLLSSPASPGPAFVPETRFGTWFLATDTWRVHVLQRALHDLQRLEPALPKGGAVLDIGTGHGFSLCELSARFEPSVLHALDPDPEFANRSAANRAACKANVQMHNRHAEQLPLDDASVDLIFCHQTLHHIVDQEAALKEMWRVLRPGGWLLLAESTRAYIHSWIIRLLFRHPMEVQRSADEYLAMLKQAGFHIDPEHISTPYLWWSRSDLGAREWLGFGLPKVREETLLNVVARKPE